MREPQSETMQLRTPVWDSRGAPGFDHGSQLRECVLHGGIGVGALAGDHHGIRRLGVAAPRLLAGQARMGEHQGGEILAHVSLADGTKLDVETHGHSEVQRAEAVQVGGRGELCDLFTGEGTCLDTLHARELPN